MKKILTGVLVLCLVLAGCGRGETVPSSGGGPVASGAFSEAEKEDSDTGVSRPSQEDASTSESGEAVTENHEKILNELEDYYLSLYGIMINNEDWDSPEEIPVTMYYAWYRDYINSITTVETRMERYKIQSEKYLYGWAYPAAEFEAFVQSYFTVSQEHLRNSDVYQPEENVFWIPGGGVNIRKKIKIENKDDLQIAKNQLLVRLACSYQGDFTDTVYKDLTMDISETPYKFVCCTSADL